MSERDSHRAELAVVDGGNEGAPEHQKPLFHVVKGNPSEEEVGVLTAVFASLAAEAQKAADSDRYRPVNNWGSIAERLDAPRVFNPNAFRNVRYY